jgi:hypothetical protein
MRKSTFILPQVLVFAIVSVGCQMASKTSDVSSDRGINAIKLPDGAVPVSNPTPVTASCDEITACTSVYIFSDLGCVIRGPQLVKGSFQGGNNCSDSQTLIEAACQKGLDIRKLTIQCYSKKGTGEIQGPSNLVMDAASVRKARADMKRRFSGVLLTGVGGTSEQKSWITVTLNNAAQVARFNRLKNNPALFLQEGDNVYYKFGRNVYLIQTKVIEPSAAGAN